MRAQQKLDQSKGEKVTSSPCADCSH